MALDVQIKKDVAFLNIIEDMEKFITLAADKLLIDMSNTVEYPALDVSGTFTNPNGVVAYSAQVLATPRTIALSGDCSGSVEFDGSGNVIITTTVSGGTPGAHTHLSVDITDATNLNEASKIVKRDTSGNFVANIITASLSGNASTATSAASATNVTTSINGKAITSIFESNGTTVKLATAATSATSATNADTVDNKHYSDIVTDINNISLINAIIFG